VAGGWIGLNNIELHKPYSSPSVIRMIKSRRMRWEGHVAHKAKEQIQGFGGKRRSIEATMKTSKQMG
jgi:hypothetical protein